MNPRRWIVGGIASAALFTAIHLWIKALPLGGPPWYLAAFAAAVLLVTVYEWRKGDLDEVVAIGRAVGLGLGAFSYVFGLKLLVIGLVVLSDGDVSAKPFGNDDVSLIAFWGFVMILAASKTICNIWAGRPILPNQKL